MLLTTQYLRKEFTEDIGVDWIDDEEEQVLLLLDKVISTYLAQHFEKLLSIMYRMDIDEQKFSLALESEKPSLLIAKLVLDREKQRIEIREKYKNKDNK